MKLKLNQWLIMNKEFGLRNYTQTNPGSIRRLVQAYLQLRSENTWFHNIYDKKLKDKLFLEMEIENLKTQKKILFHSLEFARDNINQLESQNIVLTLKLNASQAINFTLGFCLLLSFLSFGTVVLALTNLVNP